MNKVYASLIALALGFGGGWMVNGWRLDAKAQAERLGAAKATIRLTDGLAATNDENLAKLEKSQNETNRLRDCLRTGTCGLRIHTICPTTAPSASVDTGEGAELAEPARRAYFALRDAIDKHQAQLDACQDQLRLRTP